MSTIGPKITLPSWIGYQVSQNADSEQAIILGSYVAPAPGWLTRVGVYARKVNNSPRLTLAVYSVDAGGNPSRLLGQTDKMPLTTGGGNFEGALNTPAYVEAGQTFALAFVVDGGTAEFAALANTKHWKRQVGSGVPTDPFGFTSIATETGVGLYAEFQANTKPSVSLTAPAAGATLNTVTPTLQGSFIDIDSVAPTLDKLSQYRFELRLLGQTTLTWAGGPFSASPSEIAASAFARVYSGPSIIAGNSYEWRSAVADSHGEWSDWSAWRTFTLNAIGFVDTNAATSPAAKVDGDTTLIDWGGSWSHPSGQAMTNAQVQILDDDGTVLKIGNVVAVAAANGNSFVIPHATAGIGSISPGTYSYQIKGQASGGLWSAWSAPKTFIVNSPPNTPSNLQPPSGTSYTEYPLLEWNIDDPDVDDIVGVGVNSEIEFTTPNTVLTITTLNYDNDRKKGFFQLGATQMPTTGVYKWRVRGNDLSAGVFGVGQWSQQQTFNYVAGPQVTITSPSANQAVTNSAPNIVWTVSPVDQVKYQVLLYNVDAKQPFKDSGVITSPIGIFTIPAGWLKNLSDYDTTVTAWNAANVPGTSLRRQFSVSYVAPAAPTVLNASLYQNERDYEPSSVLLTWPDSSLPPGEFGGWLVWRRLSTDDPQDAILLTTITSAAQRQWIDYNAPPNVPITYGLSQIRNAGTGGYLASDVVETEIDVPLQVPTLTSLIDGRARRAAIVRWKPGGSLKGGFKHPQALYQTWGSKGKNQLVGLPAAYGAQPITIQAVLKTDRDMFGNIRGTRQQHLDDIEGLAFSGDPLCLRLEHKRLFCVISDYSWAEGDEIGTTTVNLSLDEIDYREGQTTSGLT